MEAPNLKLPTNFIIPKPVLITLWNIIILKKVAFVVLVIFSSNFPLRISWSKVETLSEMLWCGWLGDGSAEARTRKRTSPYLRSSTGLKWTERYYLVESYPFCPESLFKFKDLVSRIFKNHFQGLTAQKKKSCPNYVLLCCKSSGGDLSQPRYLSAYLSTAFCWPSEGPPLQDLCCLSKDLKNQQMKLAPSRTWIIKHMAIKLRSLLVAKVTWDGFFLYPFRVENCCHVTLTTRALFSFFSSFQEWMNCLNVSLLSSL